MKKKDNKKKRLILTGIVLVLGIALIISGIWLMNRNKAAYERQDQEVSLAADYLSYLLEYASELDAEQESKEMSHRETLQSQEEMSHRETLESNETVSETAEESKTQEAHIIRQTSITPEGEILLGGGESETQIVRDDVYFERNGKTYTPDYATGTLQFVLYYPSLGINRGVYGGDEEAIYKDLDIWMACIGQPDLLLGQTHMLVKAHNHTQQNLSFNQLPNAKSGDSFYCIGTSGVYEYRVVDIQIMSRSAVDRLMYNMSTDTKYCYLATCGRDYYIINGQSSRYNDVVVIGELVKHDSLSDADRSIFDSASSWK